MSCTDHNNSDLGEENHRLRQANAEAMTMLAAAADRLRAVLHDDILTADMAVEAEVAMQFAVEDIDKARHRLKAAVPTKTPAVRLPPGGPTRRQGQFLAFIREYMMRNEGGVAPTHADLQRFFSLTPPSVNSMLIRLEQRGFIRRTPHLARSIELTINPDWIPPLERPFMAW